MTHWSLLGRRILAVGPGLAPLAQGPLFGAVFELAEVGRLSVLEPGASDLVLIEADAAAPEVLLIGLAALAAAPNPPPVLLLGAHLPAALVRAVMRLAHSDVLETPFTEDQLRGAVFTLLDTVACEAPAIPGKRTHCWTVMGAVGGAGATTIAVEMAYGLAARGLTEGGVALVDLNLADGAAATYLGATAAMDLAAFGPAAERVDAALLAAFATPLRKGLDLLACPRNPLAFEKVSRDAVLRIMEIACEAYGHVVVDLPRHRRPWTLDVIGGCDELVVVSELTVPALLAARSLSDEIEDALPPHVAPRIVLNRMASRLFGPAPSMAEAERALQRKAEGAVSSDWEAAASSVNLGGPICQHRPKSRIVRDVARLVDQLLDPTVQARTEPLQVA